ncbi:hypothetical protein Fcan01_25906 [Folsomia candida]|uniref:Uncharacterized protein n=1 Tax=Folsomia candida TaxID=158441 RepID=A0A226D2L9_FOLCA|nr:hypothetical protein Fcan01_25906 [Folsomia candida]
MATDLRATPKRSDLSLANLPKEYRSFEIVHWLSIDPYGNLILPLHITIYTLMMFASAILVQNSQNIGGKTKCIRSCHKRGDGKRPRASTSSSSTHSDLSPTPQSVLKKGRTLRDEIEQEFGEMEQLPSKLDMLCKKFDERFDQLAKDIGGLGRNHESQLRGVKIAIKALAGERRSRNLIVLGVPEFKNQQTGRDDIPSSLKYLGEEMKLNAMDMDYDDCFRMGRFSTHAAKPRPILIKFVRTRDKQQFWQQRFALKGTKGITIRPDQPQEIRAAESILYKKYLEEKSYDHSLRSFFSRGAIHITKDKAVIRKYGINDQGQPTQIA